MKVLLLTGPLFPKCGNDANLILKIADKLSEKNEIRLLTINTSNEKATDIVKGYRTYSTPLPNPGIFERLMARICDPNGNSDYIMSNALRRKIKEVRKEYAFDFLISTLQPYFCAVAVSKISGVKKAVYIMDPPGLLNDYDNTKFCEKNISVILNNDVVLTTPFIKEALEEHGYNTKKITILGFPMICDNSKCSCDKIKMDSTKINLLFCGWLYSNIRSPEYFLKLVERLDERFCVYFMGNECDKLTERFDVTTRAEIITLPQQPYEVALDAMDKADIMINIGNSVPVHMPSKTLEYINTGKPFVNFHKMEDCPTLYYSKRYPLCLNLYEGDKDIDAAFEKLSDFCIGKKGSTVSRDIIKKEFSDCTPEYIAEKILEGTGN